MLNITNQRNVIKNHNEVSPQFIRMTNTRKGEGKEGGREGRRQDGLGRRMKDYRSYRTLYALEGTPCFPWRVFELQVIAV